MRNIESPAEIAEQADKYARATPERQINEARIYLAGRFFEAHFGWKRMIGDTYDEAMFLRSSFPEWKERMSSSDILHRDEFGYHARALDTLRLHQVHTLVDDTRKNLKTYVEKEKNKKVIKTFNTRLRRLSACSKVIGQALALNQENVPDGADTALAVEKFYGEFTPKVRDVRHTNAWTEFINKPRG